MRIVPCLPTFHHRQLMAAIFAVCVPPPEDLPFRASSLSRLQELAERAARAEKKKALAEKDLKEAR